MLLSLGLAPKLKTKIGTKIKLNTKLGSTHPTKTTDKYLTKKNHCQPRVIYRLEFNNISKLTRINNKRDERYLKGMNRDKSR